MLSAVFVLGMLVVLFSALYKTPGAKLYVAPTELENIILGLPEVSEAAVVGVPDERCGELPLAFVVPKKGEAIDPSKIISYVNQRVARHKQLAAGVRVIDHIPKNPSGKILRRELKKLIT